MARRPYGSGSLVARADRHGRETWYGLWLVGGRRVKRRIGLKRVDGSGREGLSRTQAEKELRRLMAETPTVVARETRKTEHAGSRDESQDREQLLDESVERIAGAPDPYTQLEAREALQAIRGLRPQQRLVQLLQAEGYSYREICQRCGKTYTWVNRHITEGRKAARQSGGDQ